MANNHSELEKRLWDAADDLRANSKLKSAEYSVPVLGLIFLRYADHKFALAEKKLAQQGSRRRKVGKTDYQAQGVLFLPEESRFAHLLNLPEGTDVGKAINTAMKAIETENEDLKDVLPKTYNALEKNLLVTLLKNFSSIPMTIEGDAFGKIYEYFLGNFAMSEGQRAASSSPRPASSSSSWRLSSLTTDASSTRRAGQAACSSSRRRSWSITVRASTRFPSTGRRKWPRPSASAR